MRFNTTSLYLTLSIFCLVLACTDSPPNDDNPVVAEDSITQIIAPAPDSIAVDTMAIDTTAEPQKLERPSRKPPKMKFEKTSYSYDTIQQGEVIEYSFKFKNVGERPLSISNVQGSCGCTIGSYPFLDIAPNEENSIKARFDSKNKKGSQTTTVTVYSNADPKEYVLTLKGFVKE